MGGFVCRSTAISQPSFAPPPLLNSLLPFPRLCYPHSCQDNRAYNETVLYPLVLSMCSDRRPVWPTIPLNISIFTLARTSHLIRLPKRDRLFPLQANTIKIGIDHFYFHLNKHQTKRTKSHKGNAFLFRNTANGDAKARKMSPKYKSLNFG